ncbi:hypothetical protein ABKV19_008061 [Rosa sericea]
MAKISTLTGMFLVLGLAMSVRTWAAEDENSGGGRPLTEEEIGAWINVLRGAEIALEADKIQTASAMVAGVAARLDATDLPDDVKEAKLQEMMKAIEQAVEEDNKAKAVALINAIAAEFEHQHGNARGRGTLERQLHQTENLHSVQPVLAGRLKDAFTALERQEIAKAQRILHGFYHLLKDNKELCKDKKTLIFLHAIHQTEQYIKQDARSKAEQTLQGAAFALGVGVQNQLQEGH